MEFSKTLKLEQNGLVLTLTSNESITTLKTTKSAIDNYIDILKDVLKGGNEWEMLKYFRLILIDYPSSTMSTQLRPSWCATYHEDQKQYEAEMIYWIRSIKRSLPGDRQFDAHKYLRVFYGDFISFETWCSPEFWTRKYYENQARRAKELKAEKEKNLSQIVKDLGFIS